MSNLYLSQEIRKQLPKPSPVNGPNQRKYDTDNPTTLMIVNYMSHLYMRAS